MNALIKSQRTKNSKVCRRRINFKSTKTLKLWMQVCRRNFEAKFEPMNDHTRQFEANDSDALYQIAF